MIRTLALVLLLLPLSSLAQNHLNKSRSDLKKDLDKYIEENSARSPKLTESETALTLTVTDGNKQVSHVFTFNADGKCKAEKIIADCDSCLKEELNQVLEQENYEWKKINENQYISKFSAKLLIELPPASKEFYFTILRAEWTKEMYDILTKN